MDLRSEREGFLQIGARQSAGYITGAAYMAQWLYPDLFADLDPSSAHQSTLSGSGVGWCRIGSLYIRLVSRKEISADALCKRSHRSLP